LPHRVALTDPAERARRQDRLQRAEATFEAMPFDVAAARTYGQIYAAVAAGGRKARGARAVDLLIAAIAGSIAFRCALAILTTSAASRTS
jgi:predicted nucleic acid-binding protein